MSFTCQHFCINPTKREPVCSFTAMSLAPESAPERRTASDRRLLHDHEAGSLKTLDQPLGDDLRHDLVSVVNALAAGEAQRKGKRGGNVGRVGGREFVGVGHGGNLGRSGFENKTRTNFVDAAS